MPRRHRCAPIAPRAALLSPLLAALLASPAGAQDEAPTRPETWRPEQSGRIVRVFDFEQPVVGTIRLPEHWVRAQHDPEVPRIRPDFPIWNAAELDDTVAHAGRVSVRVPVDGGSASLRLRPGVLPVFPDADYLVGASVRTEGAEFSRARLVARFLDTSGDPIPGSERTSRLLRTEGEWETVGVVLYAEHDEAAFIQIDLELVQPREFRRSMLGAHEVWRDDHGASAWFDDVTVMQLPRIELTTPAPFNIFEAGETPSIDVEVRDLTGQSLRGVLAVQDDRGREIDRRVIDMGAGRFQESWRPAVPGLGWYRAVLRLYHEGTLVGAAHADFVVLPRASEITAGAPETGTSRGAGRPRGGSLDRARFRVVVDSLDAGLMDTLPALVRRAGLGGVTLPAWEASTTDATIAERAEALGRLVSALGIDWIDASIALSRLPDEAIERTGLLPGDAFELLTTQDDDAWRPLLEPLMDRLGPRVRRWQLGPPGDDNAFWTDDLAASVRPVDDLAGGLVTMPELVLPWRADLALPGDADAPGSADVLVPAAFGPEAIELMGAAPSVEGVALTLEALPSSTYGARAAVDDLVRRAVAAWGAFDHATLDGLAIEQPWRLEGTHRRRIMPGAELAAWRNLVERLADRRRVGVYDGLAGVRCDILDESPDAAPGRGGMLVAWRDEPGGRDVLEMPLGPSAVRVYDVYANETVVEPVSRADGLRVHRIPVGRSPAFIEGVDVELVRFIAGFGLEPALVESTNEEHRAELVLTNPWPSPVSGELYVVDPGASGPDGTPDRSWQIRPRAIRFTIPAGEQTRLPITMSFSPYEEAGPHEMVVEATVSGAADSGALRMATTFDIGLEGLEMDVRWRPAPGPGGANLIVEATLTNTSDRPTLVELRAFPPGMARLRLPAVTLAPGQSATRTFVIEDGVRRLRGRTVSVNATDVDRKASLNKRVTID